MKMPRLRRSRTRFWHPKSGRKQSRGGRDSKTPKTQHPDSMGYNLDVGQNLHDEVSYLYKYPKIDGIAHDGASVRMLVDAKVIIKTVQPRSKVTSPLHMQ